MMDEMTAFERHLSAELGEMAGPGRRIDGMAMVSAISSQPPTRRIQAMFSATKFVAAGAVVALLGGILLAGLPSQPPAEVQAPAASAVSGAPGLVYMLDGDVYVAEADGTDPVRIVDGDDDRECAGLRGNRGLVSPDGRHIAVRSEWSDACPGTVSIFDLEGQLVASVPGAGWDIAWSPDGTRFATWLSWGESIGVYGLDGSLQAELDASAIELWGDYDPRWTPDGTALLLPTQIETAGLNRALVARLTLDGAEPEILPVTDPLSIRSVSFSPDGTLVASVGPESQLVVATLDGTPGGSEFFFTPGDRVDGFWARPLLWSPNSDRIAVVTRQSSTTAAGDPIQQSADLWVADPATGSSSRVDSVSGDGDLQPVAFSPHGDRILVQRYDADQGPSLWTVASDGSGSTLIVAGADVGMWVPSTRAGG
jgi:Tol biopolymer transport system component